MRRVAGCLAGITAVLAWEALTATSHPGLQVRPLAAAGDPLVMLSEGVLAQTADVFVTQKPESRLRMPAPRVARASAEALREIAAEAADRGAQIANAGACACDEAARMADAGVPQATTQARCEQTGPG
jgi:hypothetical protein